MLELSVQTALHATATSTGNVDGSTTRPPTIGKLRQASRREGARRAASVMGHLPTDPALYSAKATVDAWPANQRRRVNTPLEKEYRGSSSSSPPPPFSTTSLLYHARCGPSQLPSLRSLWKETVTGAVERAFGVEKAQAKPPLLEQIVSDVRAKLSALAARFPQFQSEALSLPTGLLDTFDDDVSFSTGGGNDGAGDSSSPMGAGSRYASPIPVTDWWDDDDGRDADVRRPPVLDRFDARSLDALVKTGADAFANERLQIFRETARHLSREFRTYRGPLRAIFAEYDKYISFCNSFVLEERSALLRIQETMLNEKRNLLLQFAEIQQRYEALEQRVAEAERVAATKTEEADAAKEALEQSLAKVSLVDKIIADGESDKGILARKLIQAEKEAETLREKLKGPERMVAALQSQLEHKEMFLKDLSRRYERACNAVDGLKRKTMEEEERAAAEAKSEQSRRATSSPRSAARGGGGAGGAGIGTAATQAVIRELRDQNAALLHRIQLMESQMHSLHAAHRQVPVLPAEGPNTEPSSSNATPRAATSREASFVQPYSSSTPPASARAPNNSSPFGSPKTVVSEVGFSSLPSVHTAAGGLPGIMSNAAAGGRKGGTAGGVVESPVFLAQLQDVAPAHRLQFCVDTVSTLLADLAEARSLAEQRAIKSEQQQQLGGGGGGAVTLSRGVGGASEIPLPHSLLYPFDDPLRRFFLGSQPDHPNRFLAVTGRVRNQKFSLLSIKSHIFTFLTDTASTLTTVPFGDRFLLWMRRKYTEEVSGMLYSFVTALSWFPNDMDAFLFRQLLDGDLPEDFWKLPYTAVLGMLREKFEKASYKHGGSVVPRREVTEMLASQFASWDLARVEEMVGLLITEDIEWRKLFSNINATTEAPFVQLIRKHWLAEHLGFRNEVYDALLEDAELGGGTVSPAMFIRALLTVDKSHPEASIVEYLCHVFGASVLDSAVNLGHLPLKDRYQLSEHAVPALQFVRKFNQLPTFRSCRKERALGGIYGLRQLKEKASS